MRLEVQYFGRQNDELDKNIVDVIEPLGFTLWGVGWDKHDKRRDLIFFNEITKEDKGIRNI